MNSLILCEGNTDAILLSYYLNKVYGWEYCRKAPSHLDIKQRELAEYLHVSQNTYSQYETGTIALTAEVLIKLAEYYKCSVDYLLDRTNDPSTSK